MRQRRLRQIGAGLIGSVVLYCGCAKKSGDAPGEVRTVTVRPVTHFDQVLDQDATAQQVAFVLLRAIRDDVLASTKSERDAAIDVQFDLAAANMIRARNRTGLTEDEFVDKVVRHWSPVVSYYVNDFETEWSDAAPRLRRTMPREIDLGTETVRECEVLLQLADPSGDPNAQVILFVEMAMDNGFWRVVHLGFNHQARTIENLRAFVTAKQSIPRTDDN